MSYIFAIDPGNTHSAFVVIDAATCEPVAIDKAENADVRAHLGAYVDSVVAIEMVASYGMRVGREVFETVFESGRFFEIAPHARLVYRLDVKLHHCHSPKANDASVTQALVDRFTPGQPNRGKGKKNRPGWFYGFAADVWQAYALAVYVADTLNREAAA